MDMLVAGDPSRVAVGEAYRRCERLARTHYENFTVVSHLLPRDRRPHLYAIYAFCRGVDDLGDEHRGDRLGALDAWEEDLRRCYGGAPAHPYMVALQQTIRALDIPEEPFLRLIEANRMDQSGTRYATFADLEHYCRHSANPVGHLVLYVLGYRDGERQRLSDRTCTALQLANFWQDVARDYRMGRVYIPMEDMERFGCGEGDLGLASATEALRRTLAFEVERTRSLFREGLKLVETLKGRFRLDVALFSLGGMAVLDAIQRQGYDVLSRRPTLSSAARLRLMLGAAFRLRLTGRV